MTRASYRAQVDPTHTVVQCELSEKLLRTLPLLLSYPYAIFFSSQRRSCSNNSDNNDNKGSSETASSKRCRAVCLDILDKGLTSRSCILPLARAFLTNSGSIYNARQRNIKRVRIGRQTNDSRDKRCAVASPPSCHLRRASRLQAKGQMWCTHKVVSEARFKLFEPRGDYVFRVRLVSVFFRDDLVCR